jgi:chromosome segregation protein
MYLKSLEISGFKSFAKKASLSFSSPISGIVGPNGSGKSNVAESFRFVLGEQSIKSMRGKRGEDLIFNGGKDGGKSNLASVKVTFDNSKRMLNVDFDEVTLERVVHRDNTNEYFINGSLVRLKDIAELLTGAHIGASGHHIISQGEADRILNANIRERREMIEDALGLKIYQYKKIESQRKLEKTDENMKSVESLRREIAPHLKFLKKQVEKVEKVEEMRQTLKSLYREYLKREQEYIAKEHARLSEEKKGPVSELHTLQTALDKAKAILAESKNADAASREVIALEQSLAEARAAKDAVVHELGKIEGEIASGRRGVEREKEKQSRDELKTVYLRDVESMVREILTLESVSEIRKIVSQFISHHRGADAQSAAVIHDLEKEIGHLETKKAGLEGTYKQASEKELEAQEAYTAVKEKIEHEKDTNREAEKDVFKIIARQNEVRGIVNALKIQEDRLAFEEEAYKRELQEAYAIVGREAVQYDDLILGLEERSAQEERRKQIEKNKIRIEDSGAGNSVDILKEYKEVEDRDAFLAREIADLEKSKESLVGLIAELDARIDIEFKEGILKINAQFQNFFALMFGGGSAALHVVREKKRKRRADTDISIDDAAIAEDMDAGMNEGNTEEEEGEEGIEISVNLPRKKVKSLMMLSGGERALTSIALLFAVSQVNPPPFIILDETDAALDEANSKKYGDMIANLAQYSQLILITHNRETMSRAGILYGVTMGADGASKLLSIEFEEAVQVAK